MAKMITGRRLDQNKQPIDGTGFEFDTEDQLADLLRQRKSPLVSQPTTGEWIFAVKQAAETGGEYERGVGIFPPGNAGPPEHFHPIYDEHFEVTMGNFVFLINGEERTMRAGDKVIVSKGTAHTFRCIGDQIGVAVVETRPAARIGDVISTLFALAHEGKLTPQGQPTLLHAMIIGSEYADDTVFTSPPPSITIPIAKLIAPLSRLLGYRSSYPEYLTDDYWSAHVEQPML